MINTSCFADHMLNVAAGTVVDGCAYQAWGSRLNMMKLKALGNAYRAGWLHNVMGRITPLTVRDQTDYVMMADLFVLTAESAEMMLRKMSRDLTAFATVSGVMFEHGQVPPKLAQHVAMYRAVAAKLEEKFGLAAPALFASTTIDAAMQAQMPFIRSFVSKYAA